ncbi:Protein SKR-1 protein, partial [Aphelenchoides avenae]
MSTLNVNNAAAPRQVTCETSGNDQVLVDLSVLRVSGTFKRMYDDLGLEDHDLFPGVFPVKTVSTRIFKRMIDWCKEHKAEPKPIIEKDPLTQQCKWFTLANSEHGFFNKPIPDLVELATAADYLDIPRLYHYACQSIAARIKGKPPGKICEILLQNCDLDDAQIGKVLDDNPWLDRLGASPRAPMENAVFIPDEVLVTVCEKLPRTDLERLQLVSTQFSTVIESSSALSARQGPVRVVIMLEFGAYFDGSPFSQATRVLLRDGTSVTCTDFKELAKRVKFATVQQLR